MTIDNKDNKNKAVNNEEDKFANIDFSTIPSDDSKGNINEEDTTSNDDMFANIDFSSIPSDNNDTVKKKENIASNVSESEAPFISNGDKDIEAFGYQEENYEEEDDTFDESKHILKPLSDEEKKKKGTKSLYDIILEATPRIYPVTAQEDPTIGMDYAALKRQGIRPKSKEGLEKYIKDEYLVLDRTSQKSIEEYNKENVNYLKSLKQFQTENKDKLQEIKDLQEEISSMQVGASSSLAALQSKKRLVLADKKTELREQQQSYLKEQGTPKPDIEDILSKEGYMPDIFNKEEDKEEYKTQVIDYINDNYGTSYTINSLNTLEKTIFGFKTANEANTEAKKDFYFWTSNHDKPDKIINSLESDFQSVKNKVDYNIKMGDAAWFGQLGGSMWQPVGHSVIAGAAGSVLSPAVGTAASIAVSSAEYAMIGFGGALRSYYYEARRNKVPEKIAYKRALYMSYINAFTGGVEGLFTAVTGLKGVEKLLANPVKRVFADMAIDMGASGVLQLTENWQANIQHFERDLGEGVLESMISELVPSGAMHIAKLGLKGTIRLLPESKKDVLKKNIEAKLNEKEVKENLIGKVVDKTIADIDNEAEKATIEEKKKEGEDNIEPQQDEGINDDLFGGEQLTVSNTEDGSPEYKFEGKRFRTKKAFKEHFDKHFDGTQKVTIKNDEEAVKEVADKMNAFLNNDVKEEEKEEKGVETLKEGEVADETDELDEIEKLKAEVEEEKKTEAKLEEDVAAIEKEQAEFEEAIAKEKDEKISESDILEVTLEEPLKKESKKKKEKKKAKVKPKKKEKLSKKEAEEEEERKNNIFTIEKKVKQGVKVFKDGVQGMLRQDKDKLVFVTPSKTIDMGFWHDVKNKDFHLLGFTDTSEHGILYTDKLKGKKISIGGEEHDIVSAKTNKQGQKIVNTVDAKGVKWQLKGSRAEEIMLNLALEKMEGDNKEKVHPPLKPSTKPKRKTYAVRKKKGGDGYVVTDNKKHAVRGVEREKAIKAYEEEKARLEGEAINEAEELIKNTRKESEDKILTLIDKAIEKTEWRGKLFSAGAGMTMLTLNTGLRLIKKAYVLSKKIKNGKTLSQIITDTINELKAKGHVVNEIVFKQRIYEMLSTEKDTSERDNKEELEERKAKEVKEEVKAKEEKKAKINKKSYFDEDKLTEEEKKVLKNRDDYSAEEYQRVKNKSRLTDEEYKQRLKERESQKESFKNKIFKTKDGIFRIDKDGHITRRNSKGKFVDSYINETDSFYDSLNNAIIFDNDEELSTHLMLNEKDAKEVKGSPSEQFREEKINERAVIKGLKERHGLGEAFDNLVNRAKEVMADKLKGIISEKTFTTIKQSSINKALAEAKAAINEDAEYLRLKEKNKALANEIRDEVLEEFNKVIGKHKPEASRDKAIRLGTAKAKAKAKIDKVKKDLIAFVPKHLPKKVRNKYEAKNKGTESTISFFTAVDKVLQAFNEKIFPYEEDKMEYLDKLRKEAEENNDNHLKIALDDLENFDNMTFKEINDVFKMYKRISKEGREAAKQITDFTINEIKDIIHGLIKHGSASFISLNSGKRNLALVQKKLINKIKKLTGERSSKKAVKMLYARGHFNLPLLLHLIDFSDDNRYDNIVDMIAESDRKRADKSREMRKDVEAAFLSTMKKKKKRFNTLKEFNDFKKNIIQSVIKGVFIDRISNPDKHKARDITVDTALDIIKWWEQKHTRVILEKYNKLTQDDINALIEAVNNVDKRIIPFINNMDAVIEKYGLERKEVHKLFTGEDLFYDEGVYLEAVRDNTGSPDGNMKEELSNMEEEISLDKMSFDAIHSGRTAERSSKSKKPMLIEEASFDAITRKSNVRKGYLSLISDYLDETAHTITKSKDGIFMKEFLNDADVRRDIERVFGKTGLDLFKELASASVNPYKYNKHQRLKDNLQKFPVTQKRIHNVINNFLISVLNGKLKQGFMQTTSFVMAFDEFNGNIGQFASKVGYVTTHYKKVFEEIKKYDAGFEDRVSKGLGNNIDFGDYNGGIGLNNISPVTIYGQAEKTVKDWGSVPITKGDEMGIMLGYAAVYLQAKKNIIKKAKADGKKMTEEEVSREAIKSFSKYESTQQTKTNLYFNWMQLHARSKSVTGLLAKGYTTYKSTGFLYLNKEMQAISRMYKSISRGGIKNVKKKDIRTFLLSHFIGNAMYHVSRGLAGLAFGHPEDLEDDLFTTTMLGAFSYLLFAAPAFEYLTNFLTDGHGGHDLIRGKVSTKRARKTIRGFKEGDLRMVRDWAWDTSISILNDSGVYPSEKIKQSFKPLKWQNTNKDIYYNVVSLFLQGKGVGGEQLRSMIDKSDDVERLTDKLVKLKMIDKRDLQTIFSLCGYSDFDITGKTYNERHPKSKKKSNGFF